MTTSSPPSYVRSAVGDKIHIAINPHDEVAKFQVLGFAADPADSGHMVLAISGDEKKAKIFSHLRDIGVLFSAGKEWCPSELFEYYRDKKLLSGEYQCVAWKNPNEWEIRNVK